jgi:hypothetical protein
VAHVGHGGTWVCATVWLEYKDRWGIWYINLIGIVLQTGIKTHNNNSLVRYVLSLMVVMLVMHNIGLLC